MRWRLKWGVVLGLVALACDDGTGVNMSSEKQSPLDFYYGTDGVEVFVNGLRAQLATAQLEGNSELAASTQAQIDVWLGKRGHDIATFDEEFGTIFSGGHSISRAGPVLKFQVGTVMTQAGAESVKLVSHGTFVELTNATLSTVYWGGNVNFSCNLGGALIGMSCVTPQGGRAVSECDLAEVPSFAHLRLTTQHRAYDQVTGGTHSGYASSTSPDIATCLYLKKEDELPYEPEPSWDPENPPPPPPGGECYVCTWWEWYENGVLHYTTPECAPIDPMWCE
jgi:hypothetical protein